MKDIDEAIQHCEDVAQQQDMLKRRYDDASGYTRSGNEAIRTSDAKKCEKCAADHRQLAEWLKELKQLRDEMLETPPIVIATAYLYAINYVRYGEDVTEKWVTATQNARALEKAYRKGYHDALHKLTESEE